MHNKRCENANPDSPCRCSCGGKYHGTRNKKPDNTNIRSINEKLDGEVAKVLNALTGKEYRCTCGKNTILRNFMGYIHSDGVPDENGTKWWILFICPKCKHQWSWDKIQNRINNFKSLDEFY